MAKKTGATKEATENEDVPPLAPGNPSTKDDAPEGEVSDDGMENVTKISMDDLVDQGLPSSKVEDFDESTLDYDLGNLCVSDANPLPEDYNEGSLKQLARNHVQLLFNKLWELEVDPVRTKALGGKIVQLPKPGHDLPREKMVPKPRPLTRWERFKKDRGLNTRKKDKLVFDEESGEWKKRWGRDRANNEMDQPVVEHVEGLYENGTDPWQYMKQQRKARVANNKRKFEQNLQEASGNTAPGAIDLHTAVENSSKRRKLTKLAKGHKKDQAHLNTALRIAQTSTASMGKFDKLSRGEGKISLKAHKKRKPEESQGKEKDKNLRILRQVVGKASKEKHGFSKEKAGRLAKVNMDEKKRRRKSIRANKFKSKRP